MRNRGKYTGRPTWRSRSYKKAVRRGKRDHEEKECDRLEAMLRDPKSGGGS